MSWDELTAFDVAHELCIGRTAKAERPCAFHKTWRVSVRCSGCGAVIVVDIGEADRGTADDLVEMAQLVEELTGKPAEALEQLSYEEQTGLMEELTARAPRLRELYEARIEKGRSRERRH